MEWDVQYIKLETRSGHKNNNVHRGSRHKCRASWIPIPELKDVYRGYQM